MPRPAPRGLTVHIETCPHVFRTLEEIKALGCKAGVTLNPGTPVRALEAVLPHADLVLIMSVNPGFLIPELPAGRHRARARGAAHAG